MLAKAKASNFPEALKKARESKGYSFTQLAKLCHINPVMPSRYENREHGNFCAPSQNTWDALNKVLFDIEPPNSDSNDEKRLLKDASMDELIQELKNRYAVTSITITL